MSRRIRTSHIVVLSGHGQLTFAFRDEVEQSALRCRPAIESCEVVAKMPKNARFLTVPTAIICFAIAGLLNGVAPAWGAQALWAADSVGDQIQEFAPSELLTTGSPTPTVLNTVGDLTFGIAFDQAENLWVVIDTGSVSEIVEFSVTQLQDLGSNSAPAPAAVITSASFANLRGCAFDHKGNLWVADANAGVHEISSAQLADGTADLTPAITMTVPDFSHVNFIEFDKSGNLWVSDIDADKIYELKKKQIKSSKTVTPAVILSSATFAENEQIVFDGGGNLWVANSDGNNVQKFRKKSIKKSGHPTAAVTISDDSMTNLEIPSGLAFDANGDLWVSNYHDGSISEYTTSQIKSSGNPTPAVHLTNTSNLLAPYQITFGPAD
jgi:streptogramin lyase